MSSSSTQITQPDPPSDSTMSSRQNRFGKSEYFHIIYFATFLTLFSYRFPDLFSRIESEENDLPPSTIDSEEIDPPPSTIDSPPEDPQALEKDWRPCCICNNLVKETIFYLNTVGSVVAHQKCLRKEAEKLLDVMLATAFLAEKLCKIEIDNAQSGKNPSVQTTVVSGKILEPGEKSRPIAYYIHQKNDIKMNNKIAILLFKIIEAIKKQKGTIYFLASDGGPYFTAATKYFLTEDFLRCVMCLLKNELEKICDQTTVHPLKLLPDQQAYVKKAVGKIGSGMSDRNLTKMVTVLNELIVNTTDNPIAKHFFKQLLSITEGVIKKTVIGSKEQDSLTKFSSFLKSNTNNFSDSIYLLWTAVDKMVKLSSESRFPLTYEDFTVVEIENVISATNDYSPYTTLINLNSLNDAIVCGITETMKNEYVDFARAVLATNSNNMKPQGVNMVNY